MGLTPPDGPIGTRVEIAGIGFGATVGENSATVNGVPAAVVRASRCAITIEIPPGATSGPIIVSTPAGTATSLILFSVSRVSLATVASAAVIGQSVRFTASMFGCPDDRVTWSVNGVQGGAPGIGTISADGVYLAPLAVPTPATIVIQAESTTCASLVATRSLTIVAAANAVGVAAISVKRGALPTIPPPATVAQAVSVQRGRLPVAPPPSMTAHAVSVNRGELTVMTPPAMLAHAVSITRGPVVSEVSPAAATAGATIVVTVIGANLTGASEVLFFLDGRPDPSITVTSVTVHPAGDSLSAGLVILATSPAGPRTVVVRTATAASTPSSTGNNVFTVTAP